mmetsp:Transcript_47512/g.87302  ORF Transcript_47512/g.87302 Transcript_47512/m.87302 type:complete len:99 (-) Transcript_47512:132-428(-)
MSDIRQPMICKRFALRLMMEMPAVCSPSTHKLLKEDAKAKQCLKTHSGCLAKQTEHKCPTCNNCKPSQQLAVRPGNCLCNTAQTDAGLKLHRQEQRVD